MEMARAHKHARLKFTLGLNNRCSKRSENFNCLVILRLQNRECNCLTLGVDVYVVLRYAIALSDSVNLRQR